MIKLRRNVFETNSSSSHSISIRKEGKYITAEELDKMFSWRVRDDGKLLIWGSDLEFGRSPFEVLANFYDKLRFAIASLGCNDEKREELETVMYELIPGLQTIDYPTQRDWNTNKKKTYYGYIDHQSLGLLQNFLESHNISIKEFLTNSRYVVWIDGDEYNVKEDLFDSGLCHKEDFVEVDAGYSDNDLEWEEYKKEHPDWDKVDEE